MGDSSRRGKAVKVDLMARRKKAAPVALTATQRERLERLWFYYGNYGPRTTPGNHQFIQGLLEHGLDLRPLRTKRTPKSEIPTAECEAAVDAVLATSADGAGRGDGPAGGLRLRPPPDGGRKPPVPDPELKGLIDDLRRRSRERHGEKGCDPNDRDAA
jgi:hypothetical protein